MLILCYLKKGGQRWQKLIAVILPVIFSVTFITPALAYSSSSLLSSLSNAISAPFNDVKSDKYLPYLTIGGAKYFNHASSAAGIYDLFIPLTQTQEQLFFTDLRIFDRSGSSFEGNIHLGYRKLCSAPETMFGIYGAFDRKKSYEGNFFNQTTVGIEYWQNNLFIGGNLYIPIGSGPKAISDIHKKVDIDRNIGTRTTKHKIQISQGTEKPLVGVDLLLGYAFTDNLTAYWGGYLFKANDTATILGPKINLTYNCQKPYGRMLGVIDSVGVEIGGQYDKPRGIAGYIGINLKVGLTSSTKNANMSGFKRHMVELVRRDQDIVVQKTKTPQPIHNYVEKNELIEKDFVEETPDIDSSDPDKRLNAIWKVNEAVKSANSDSEAKEILEKYSGWIYERLKKISTRIDIVKPFSCDDYKRKLGVDKNIDLFDEIHGLAASARRAKRKNNKDDKTFQQQSSHPSQDTSKDTSTSLVPYNYDNCGVCPNNVTYSESSLQSNDAHGGIQIKKVNTVAEKTQETVEPPKTINIWGDFLRYSLIKTTTEVIPKTAVNPSYNNQPEFRETHNIPNNLLQNLSAVNETVNTAEIASISTVEAVNIDNSYLEQVNKILIIYADLIIERLKKNFTRNEIIEILHPDKMNVDRKVELFNEIYRKVAYKDNKESHIGLKPESLGYNFQNTSTALILYKYGICPNHNNTTNSGLSQQCNASDIQALKTQGTIETPTTLNTWKNFLLFSPIKTFLEPISKMIDVTQSSNNQLVSSETQNTITTNNNFLQNLSAINKTINITEFVSSNDRLAVGPSKPLANYLPLSAETWSIVEKCRKKVNICSWFNNTLTLVAVGPSKPLVDYLPLSAETWSIVEKCRKKVNICSWFNNTLTLVDFSNQKSFKSPKPMPDPDHSSLSKNKSLNTTRQPMKKKRRIQKFGIEEQFNNKTKKISSLLNNGTVYTTTQNQSLNNSNDQESINLSSKPSKNIGDIVNNTLFGFNLDLLDEKIVILINKQDTLDLFKGFIKVLLETNANQQSQSASPKNITLTENQFDNKTKDIPLSQNIKHSTFNYYRRLFKNISSLILNPSPKKTLNSTMPNISYSKESVKLPLEKENSQSFNSTIKDQLNNKTDGGLPPSNGTTQKLENTSNPYTSVFTSAATVVTLAGVTNAMALNQVLNLGIPFPHSCALTAATVLSVTAAQASGIPATGYNILAGIFSWFLPSAPSNSTNLPSNSTNLPSNSTNLPSNSTNLRGFIEKRNIPDLIKNTFKIIEEPSCNLLIYIGHHGVEICINNHSNLWCLDEKGMQETTRRYFKDDLDEIWAYEMHTVPISKELFESMSFFDFKTMGPDPSTARQLITPSTPILDALRRILSSLRLMEPTSRAGNAMAFFGSFAWALGPEGLGGIKNFFLTYNYSFNNHILTGLKPYVTSSDIKNIAVALVENDPKKLAYYSSWNENPYLETGLTLFDLAFYLHPLLIRIYMSNPAYLLSIAHLGYGISTYTFKNLMMGAAINGAIDYGIDTTINIINWLDMFEKINKNRIKNWTHYVLKRTSTFLVLWDDFLAFTSKPTFNQGRSNYDNLYVTRTYPKNRDIRPLSRIALNEDAVPYSNIPNADRDIRPLSRIALNEDAVSYSNIPNADNEIFNYKFLATVPIINEYNPSEFLPIPFSIERCTRDILMTEYFVVQPVDYYFTDKLPDYITIKMHPVLYNNYIHTEKTNGQIKDDSGYLFKYDCQLSEFNSLSINPDSKTYCLQAYIHPADNNKLIWSPQENLEPLHNFIKQAKNNKPGYFLSKIQYEKDQYVTLHYLASNEFNVFLLKSMDIPAIKHINSYSSPYYQISAICTGIKAKINNQISNMSNQLKAEANTFIDLLSKWIDNRGIIGEAKLYKCLNAFCTGRGENDPFSQMFRNGVSLPNRSTLKQMGITIQETDLSTTVLSDFQRGHDIFFFQNNALTSLDALYRSKFQGTILEESLTLPQLEEILTEQLFDRSFGGTKEQIDDCISSDAETFSKAREAIRSHFLKYMHQGGYLYALQTRLSEVFNTSNASESNNIMLLDDCFCRSLVFAAESNNIFLVESIQPRGYLDRPNDLSLESGIIKDTGLKARKAVLAWRVTYNHFQKKLESYMTFYPYPNNSFLDFREESDGSTPPFTSVLNDLTGYAYSSDPNIEFNNFASCRNKQEIPTNLKTEAVELNETVKITVTETLKKIEKAEKTDSTTRFFGKTDDTNLPYASESDLLLADALLEKERLSKPADFSQNCNKQKSINPIVTSKQSKIIMHEAPVIKSRDQDSASNSASSQRSDNKEIVHKKLNVKNIQSSVGSYIKTKSASTTPKKNKLNDVSNAINLENLHMFVEKEGRVRNKSAIPVLEEKNKSSIRSALIEGQNIVLKTQKTSTDKINIPPSKLNLDIADNDVEEKIEDGTNTARQTGNKEGNDNVCFSFGFNAGDENKENYALNENPNKTAWDINSQLSIGSADDMRKTLDKHKYQSGGTDADITESNLLMAGKMLQEESEKYKKRLANYNNLIANNAYSSTGLNQNVKTDTLSKPLFCSSCKKPAYKSLDKMRSLEKIRKNENPDKTTWEINSRLSIESADDMRKTLDKHKYQSGGTDADITGSDLLMAGKMLQEESEKYKKRLANYNNLIANNAYSSTGLNQNVKTDTLSKPLFCSSCKKPDEYVQTTSASHSCTEGYKKQKSITTSSLKTSKNIDQKAKKAKLPTSASHSFTEGYKKQKSITTGSLKTSKNIDQKAKKAKLPTSASHSFTEEYEKQKSVTTSPLLKNIIPSRNSNNNKPQRSDNKEIVHKKPNFKNKSASTTPKKNKLNDVSNAINLENLHMFVEKEGRVRNKSAIPVLEEKNKSLIHNALIEGQNIVLETQKTSTDKINIPPSKLNLDIANNDAEEKIEDGVNTARQTGNQEGNDNAFFSFGFNAGDENKENYALDDQKVSQFNLEKSSEAIAIEQLLQMSNNKPQSSPQAPSPPPPHSPGKKKSTGEKMPEKSIGNSNNSVNLVLKSKNSYVKKYYDGLKHIKSKINYDILLNKTGQKRTQSKMRATSANKKPSQQTIITKFNRSPYDTNIGAKTPVTLSSYQYKQSGSVSKNTTPKTNMLNSMSGDSNKTLNQKSSKSTTKSQTPNIYTKPTKLVKPFTTNISRCDNPNIFDSQVMDNDLISISEIPFQSPEFKLLNVPSSYVQTSGAQCNNHIMTFACKETTKINVDAVSHFNPNRDRHSKCINNHK